MTITKCPPGVAQGAYFEKTIRPAHGIIRFEGKNYPNKKIRMHAPSLEERSREFDFIGDGFAAARAIKRRRETKA